MRFPVVEVIGGTTLTLTWVNSGVIPSQLELSLHDKHDALVSSATPVASGNGHYFAPLYVPTSDPWYVGRSIAVVDANTYVNRLLVKAFKMEVD